MIHIDLKDCCQHCNKTDCCEGKKCHICKLCLLGPGSSICSATHNRIFKSFGDTLNPDNMHGAGDGFPGSDYD